MAPLLDSVSAGVIRNRLDMVLRTLHHTAPTRLTDVATDVMTTVEQP